MLCATLGLIMPGKVSSFRTVKGPRTAPEGRVGGGGAQGQDKAADFMERRGGSQGQDKAAHSMAALICPGHAILLPWIQPGFAL